MQIRPNKSWLLLGVGILLGASAAFAASSRYDEAVVSIDKAKALLNNVADEKGPAAFQRERAIKALERAKMRIACAKHAADTGKKGCPAAKGSRFDDNDDEKEHEDTPNHPPKAPKEPPPKAPKEPVPPKAPQEPVPPKAPKAPPSPKAPANP